jgi:hypothetical protein
MMTEYWTDLTFNRCSGGFCSPYIRTYNGRDGGAWHREGPFGCCGGWSRESSDHYLYVCGGGLGYTTVTLCGHQGYSYNGVFDHSGNDYYNSFWNSITGSYTGNWTCSYSYSLRKTAAGWHSQNWCVTGLYSG